MRLRQCVLTLILATALLLLAPVSSRSSLSPRPSLSVRRQPRLLLRKPPHHVVAQAEASPSPQHSSLLSTNILMLFFYSTLGSVMPYLPIYYRYCGASDVQLGLLGAITPAVIFLVSPLWGALADSSGRHKQVMLLTFLGSVVARCLMLLRPNILMLSIIVAISAVLYAPVKPLLDSAALAMLTDKTAFGRSRLFGQIGFGIGSYLVGPLLSTHVRAIFVVQALLAMPTALLMSTFNPKPMAEEEDTSTANRLSRHRFWKHVSVLNYFFKPPVKAERLPLWESVRQVMRNTDTKVFFFLVFLIGISSGIVENFAYLRLSESGLQGMGNVLGISRLASSLAGGPMFWLSGNVVKALGINGVIALSLLAYAMRFVVYASISNPWHALPAELLRGVTFALFWSGATYHVYSISPKGLTATMVSSAFAVIVQLTLFVVGIAERRVRRAGTVPGIPHWRRVVQKHGHLQRFLRCRSCGYGHPDCLPALSSNTEMVGCKHCCKQKREDDQAVMT